MALEAIDRREDILDRLYTIMQDVEGVETVFRNKRIREDDALPSIQVMDADEEANDGDPPQRPSNSPRRVGMTPEIFITLGADNPDSVGTILNTVRRRVIRAVLTDTTLQAICTNAGSIRYVGCTTALQLASTLKGQMGVTFTFNYPLFAGELIEPSSESA